MTPNHPVQCAERGGITQNQREREWEGFYHGKTVGSWGKGEKEQS